MNRDLTVGKAEQVLLRFCLPLFGSIVFQQLYNLADSFVAGKFLGENALAAVGNSYEITLIFIAFAFGCNIGCSVISAQFFGAKQYKQLKTTVHTAFLFTGGLCLFLMLLGWGFCEKLLHWVQTPREVFSDSLTYLYIYIGGLPFLFFYNVSTGIFSALGDSRTPFLFLAFSSTANIFADIFAVTNLGMGVDGVAWATFLCQGLSCILAVLVVLKRLRALPEKGGVFSPSILKSFLKIAIPSTLQQGFVSIGNIILQGIINGFGTGVIAGYSAGVKLNNLVITSFTTIGNGISNYAAQNLGAQKPRRLEEGFRAGLKLIWALSLPMALLYFFLGETLVRFFLDAPSPMALSTGRLYLQILSPFYFVVSAKLISDGILRGAGRMNPFMVCTFLDLILRVSLAAIFSRLLNSATGIWLAWPIGWTTGTLLSLFFCRRLLRELKTE